MVSRWPAGSGGGGGGGPADLGTATGILSINKGGTGSATGFSDLEDDVLALQSGKENSFAVLPVNKGGTGSATGFTDLQTQVNARLPLSGGTMTGILSLSGPPVNNLDATTKAYVDALGGIVIQTYNSAGAPAIQNITANTHNLFNTTQATGNFYWASLPSPSNGSFVVIKDSTGNAHNCPIVIITGQSIDGRTSYTILNPFESVRLISNGAAWFII